MNAAELLDTVFHLYKKTFWRQMVRVFIFGIPAYIFLVVYVLAGVVVFGTAQASGGSFTVRAVVFAVVFVLLFLVWEALSVTGNISLNRQAYNGPVSLDIMFKDIKHNFFTSFSAVFAVFLLAAPFIAAAAVYAVRALRSITGFDFAGVAVYVVIGAVVFYLATVVFEALTTAAVPCSVYERKTFLSAVLRSFAILRGGFAQVFGVVFMWRLVVLIVNVSFVLVYYLAAGSVGGAVGLLTDNYAVAAAPLALGSNILSIVVTLLLTPFGGILSTCIYLSRRICAEGYDIVMAVEALGS